MPDEVYHQGEIAVQERTGARSIAQRRAAIVGDWLPPGAREFLAVQVAAGAAAVAPDGTVWASMWCGEPGFLRSDAEGEQVQVVAALDRTPDVDPVRRFARAADPIALVAIDFTTRQRLRVNGATIRQTTSGLAIGVREAFGNCIKYIQQREPSPSTVLEPGVAHRSGEHLDGELRDFIERTDTLFVASIHPQRGLDVSHRGGHPGFVHLEGATTLRIPDYAGNGMYQTLGNFEVDPRAGVALIDFERRRVLSLTGRAQAAFGSEDPAMPTGGTGRYWSFTVARWEEYPLSHAIQWRLIERSPFNPKPSA